MGPILNRICLSILPVIIALVIPFVSVDRLRGYSCDVEIFDTWSACIWNGAAVHGVCERFHVNYPSIGILGSAGVMELLTELGVKGNYRGKAQPFRQVLAIVDAINLLLFLALLKSLRIRFAEWWTVVFAVLPSTRVGGAMFGQIDGISQLFLSMGFLSLNQAWSALEKGSSRIEWWLGILAGSILAAVCTKQLVIFTVPVLALGLGYLWYQVTMRYGHPLRLYGGVALIGVVLLLLDRIFPVPPGYLGSMMLYSVGAGSGHAREIGNNGFNIFTLLPVPPSSPSDQWYPFFSVWGLRVSGIPFYIGVSIFLVFNLMAAWSVYRITRPLRSIDATRATIAALAIAALLNLSMNVFLTGTHERYLYHYGFFVMPCVLWLLGQGKVGLGAVALIAAHLMVYGIFVYSKIGHLSASLMPLSSQLLIVTTTFFICVMSLVRLVQVSHATESHSKR